MPICTLSSPGPFRVGLPALFRPSNIGGRDERLRLPKVDEPYCRDAATMMGSRVRPWGGGAGGGDRRGRSSRGVERTLEVVEERIW